MVVVVMATFTQSTVLCWKEGSCHRSSYYHLRANGITNKEHNLLKNAGVNILARYGAENFRVGALMPWEVTVKISGL